MFKELGQLNNAIGCYEQALGINPGFPEAFHNLGSALLLSGRYAEAVVSLKQAVALKPNFNASRVELEKALQKLKQQQK